MSIDYINESYFAVVGLTGAGKSLFLNAISGYNSCIVASSGKACTQKNQLVSFVYNNHRFNALDTPGLDDTDNNQEKIKMLKNILKVHPKIKKIIIIKKYNDLRIPESMQNAFATFMEAFPLKTFWDHVVIVNTWANPHDESYTDYREEHPNENLLTKILECQNLVDIMRKKNINVPSKLKEYFVCSKKIQKYKEIADIFNTIKEDIRDSILMFKNVEVSPILERSVQTKKNPDFYIVTKYKTITCIDYDDTKSTIEEIVEEKEVAPKDCKVIDTEEVSEKIGTDDVRWYDIVSLGIARAIRNTDKYQVYKINTYQVGDKRIKGDKVKARIEFR